MIQNLLKDESCWHQARDGWVELARKKGTELPVLSGVAAMAPDECSFTLTGAMLVAYPDHDEMLIANGKIRDLLPRGFDIIDHWNNHPETTFNDIRKLIEEANV
jgi:hypothetical protein